MGSRRWQLAGQGISVRRVVDRTVLQEVARTAGRVAADDERSIQRAAVGLALSLKACAGPRWTASSGSPPGSPWPPGGLLETFAVIAEWQGRIRQAGLGKRLCQATCQTAQDAGPSRDLKPSASAPKQLQALAARGFRLSLINRQWENRCTPGPPGRELVQLARPKRIACSIHHSTAAFGHNPRPLPPPWWTLAHRWRRQRSGDRRLLVVAVHCASSRPTRRSASTSPLSGCEPPPLSAGPGFPIPPPGARPHNPAGPRATCWRISW